MVVKVTRRATDTKQVYGCNLRVMVYGFNLCGGAKQTSALLPRTD